MRDYWAAGKLLYLCLLVRADVSAMFSGASVWDITGPLCPNGNLTFSDLPTVTRIQLSDRFTVSWGDVLENGVCATGLYLKWWIQGFAQKEILVSTNTKTVDVTVTGQSHASSKIFQVGAYKDDRDGKIEHVVLSARVLFEQHSTPRSPEAEFPSAPKIKANQNSIEVAWNPPRDSNGIVKMVKDYIVRWRAHGEQDFQESEKLQRWFYKIQSRSQSQSYTVQVVARVEEPLPQGGSFIKWIKGPEAHTVRTIWETTTTKLPSKVKQTHRTSKKALSTTRLPSKVKQTHMTSTLKPPIIIKSTIKQKIFEEPECGSISSFEKKCTVNSSSTSLRVFDEFDSNYITAFATIFSIMGVILNLLVLVSVLNYRVTRKHVTTPYIVSCILSDLIYSAFVLPITAVRFQNNIAEPRVAALGETMCRIYPIIYYTVQGSSLLSLTLVNLERAAMLYIPTKVHKIFTNSKNIGGHEVPVNSILLLSICWCIPFIGLLPTIFGANGCLGLQQHTLSCTILPDVKGHSPKVMMYSVTFAIPCITIIACDIAIYFKMKELQQAAARLSTDNREEERNTEKKFMYMLVTILFIFFITYLPGFIVKTVDSCYTFPTLHAIAYTINWASVWINPIVYVVAQKKWQDALKQLFPCLAPKKVVEKKKIRSFNLSSSTQPESQVEQDRREETFLTKYMDRLRTPSSRTPTPHTLDAELSSTA